MKKEIQSLPEKKLIGLCLRTNNSLEMNPQTGKIAKLVSEYFAKDIAGQLTARSNPGVTFGCYTEYESDEHGNYLYFIGEEVDVIDSIPDGLKGLVIPASKYAKFTTNEGQMPTVVISAWQEIWQMHPEILGGNRAFQADFEIYDQRAMDPSKTIVDIYIGIH